MGALGQLRQAFEVAGRAIGFASETQGGARRELVDSLEQVASKCDDAYTEVRTALRPVRDSYRDPAQLGAALRAFAADAHVRTSIKPHQLCGEVTALLDKLANNLDPLKWPYAFEWGGRVRRRGTEARSGQRMPPAWRRTRSR